jgi:hypothetical protein
MSAQVNVRFRCTVAGCDCDAVLPARLVVRDSGEHLYEYTNLCPTCAHRLARHSLVGETTVLTKERRA